MLGVGAPEVADAAARSEVMLKILENCMAMAVSGVN
jgi:hypothetical protein